MTPTDAEIAQLYGEKTGFEITAALLDFARAVLAKWGTPPAGEHAAQICESRARSLSRDGDHAAANEARKCASAIRANTAPPVREPLTDEQVDELIKQHTGGYIGGTHFVHLCRAIEAAHGIKGGSDADT